MLAARKAEPCGWPRKAASPARVCARLWRVCRSGRKDAAGGVEQEDVASGGERPAGPQHGVEDDQQLARDGDDGDLGVTGSGEDVAVVGGQPRDMPHGGQRRHVEGLAHAPAPAADVALAAEGAAVVVEGSQAGERGNGLARAVAEFGQMGNQRDGRDRADAGRRLQKLAQGGKFARGDDLGIDARLQLLDLRVEESDMLDQAGRDGPGLGDGQALLIKKGKIVKRFDESMLETALLDEIEAMTGEKVER